MPSRQEMGWRVEEARYAMVVGNDDGEMIPPGEVDHWLDYILGVERKELPDVWIDLEDDGCLGDLD